MHRNAVEKLLEFVPAASGSKTSPNWVDVEARLGAQLPSDYKALIQHYGTGSFDGFLWLLQPSSNPHLDLVRQNDVRIEAVRALSAAGENLPQGVANIEQLVAWGITDNGDVCFWITQDEVPPDQWDVAVNEARSPDWERFVMSASEFLLEVLTARVVVGAFPSDFPSPEPVYEE